MAKRSKRAILKDKTWKAFSKYIRLRDANKNGDCVCVTCGVVKPYSQMQAGHAIGGRTNSILFHEDLVNAQCYSCNVGKSGNYNKYAIFMIEKYGYEQFKEFVELKHKIVKISLAEMQDLFEKYTKLVDELEAKL